MKWLYSRTVAQEKYLLLFYIIQGVCKHADEPVDRFHAKLLVSLDHNLGIGIGMKFISQCNELFPDFFEILNFSVQDNDHAFIIAVHRLIAIG